MTASPRIGLAVTLSHLEGLSAPKQADLLALAATVESAGATQLVLSEHVVLGADIKGHPPVRPSDPPSNFFFPSDEEYPEPLVSLAAIGAVTSTARLSTNILIAPLRPPALLAKMAATVDVLSGGRLDLGVGAGWHEPEFDALGVPLDRLRLRVAESVAACRALWAGGPSSFHGQTVSFTDMYCSPTPVQVRIPVIFGGQPNEATARLVATLGDGWSPIGSTRPDEVVQGVALIQKAMQEAGREGPPVQIRCSLGMGRDPDGRPSVAATMAEAGPLVEAGATVVQLPPLRGFLDPDAAAPVERSGDVVAEAAALLATL